MMLLDADRKQEILFRKLSAYHGYGLHIHRQLGHIHDAQLQPAGQGIQHLLLRHKAQFT